MNKKGFTLIELLVAVSIISLISLIILPDFRAGEEQLAVRRETNKLAQDLRRAEEMAISSREFAGQIPGGYGLFFKKTEPRHYIIFADVDNDKKYSAADQTVEDVSFERATLNSLSSGSELAIVFSSPDPSVTITPAASSAVVNLGKAEKKYIYELGIKTSQRLEHASCDQDYNIQDCPPSFSASAVDPDFVYDWFTETGVDYEYRWVEDVSGYQTPRAKYCDNSSVNKECPSVFPDSLDFTPFVYDQFKGEPYQYVYAISSSGHLGTRATHCDVNDSVIECRAVSPFGDIYGGFLSVYDWWKVAGSIKRSDKYTRQLTDHSQKFQKVSFPQDYKYSNQYRKKEVEEGDFSVRVNSAGLITVE